MSRLHQLPKIGAHRKKRLGRGLGSGTGAKSGRGTTRHQKAHSDIPLHFEGGQARMVKKYPLLRGKGKNKSVRPQPVAIALSELNQFKDKETIDIEKLVKSNILRAKEARRGAKILARGKLEKKLIIKLSVSSGAKKLIEKAGGTVEPL